jgi:hypothetical protein
MIEQVEVVSASPSRCIAMHQRCAASDAMNERSAVLYLHELFLGEAYTAVQDVGAVCDPSREQVHAAHRTHIRVHSEALQSPDKPDYEPKTKMQLE